MVKTAEYTNKQARSRAAAHHSAHRKEGSGGVQAFVDNRPEALAQAKLKNTIETKLNSLTPIVTQLTGYCHDTDCESYNEETFHDDDFCHSCGKDLYEGKDDEGEGESVEEEGEEEVEEVAEIVTQARLPKPPMYQVVSEGWNNKKAMFEHCYTYCGEKTKLTLVEAAKVLELDPPMLGHGSDIGGGGTKKDAELYEKFRKYMEYMLQDVKGKSLQQKARKILRT